jgi:hypothetical protein
MSALGQKRIWHSHIVMSALLYPRKRTFPRDSCVAKRRKRQPPQQEIKRISTTNQLHGKVFHASSRAFFGATFEPRNGLAVHAVLFASCRFASRLRSILGTVCIAANEPPIRVAAFRAYHVPIEIRLWFLRGLRDGLSTLGSTRALDESQTCR